MQNIALPKSKGECSCVEAREVFYLTDSVLFCVCVFCLGKNRVSQSWLEQIEMFDKARKCIKIQQFYFVVYENDGLNSENSFPVYVLSARIIQWKFKLCWFK